jgi:cation transport ATPase
VKPTTWATTAWWKSWACARRRWKQLFALEKQGKTVVLLLDRSGPLALFAVADTVKDSSREAIANCMSWASRP